MTNAFAREVAAARLPAPATAAVIAAAAPVTADEIRRFPEPIQRYFRTMRVVGRPRVWSFRLEWVGRFRRAPEEEWKRCEAWQYNTRVELARVFRLRIHYAPLVSMVAHDTYVRGHGRMQGKLFDRIKVVDAAGPELDTGELVTYLNDAVLVAPAMLLGPEVRFTPVDSGSFDVALTDRERTVEARVYLDDDGAPVSFSTLDRYLQPPDHPEGGWQRCRWSTPIDGWQLGPGGHPLPTAGRATWHLASAPFTYAELQPVPTSLRLNVLP
jgi:uncharacterized protein DUF6544